MNDEHGKIVKQIGNFSLAVIAALLATPSSSSAYNVGPATEAQSNKGRVGISSIAPAVPSHISGFADIDPNIRFTTAYANYYTNWSDYTNHSNYSNYYSNWADYANQPK